MAAGNNANAFLGQGFKFPVQADPATGRMRMSSYEEDIQEAISIILLTRKGERVRNPEFGCAIHDYIFGTLDFTSLKEIERSAEEALILWEPRIRDIDVEVMLDEQESGKLLVKIEYVVRTTNNPFNLVFPFYLNEGFGDQA
ncbi:MAG: GPW/gp25 family protein [Clostridium sp.]|nr:GPW/gp25 family protein [Clostridium sp.]